MIRIVANKLREKLRKSSKWVQLQELNREGWVRAYKRRRIQTLILKTRPVITDLEGLIEVRMVTWRRDWLNALWTLKSFYFYSQVNYPLVIHDGGLEPSHIRELRKHFPHAKFIPREKADQEVSRRLKELGCQRCLSYRSQNIATLKLFDFFLLSQSSWVITLDPDVLFFKKPSELLLNENQQKVNLYNRDCQYAYSMELDELEKCFGIRPPLFVNSGLSRVSRASIHFPSIEKWLTHPKLYGDKWVTEQTLHALCSTAYGVELLPLSYLVSTEPGLPENIVAKHYPGFFRPLLYTEGMEFLKRKGQLLSES